MQDDSRKKIGLVLPAGGARAAYQVGVLSYVAENFPSFQPKIFTGISAGSINACFLAQGEEFPLSAHKLFELWANLRFNQVMKTNFRSLISMTLRWIADLYLSGLTRKLLFKSLLDATPLSTTLLNHIHFWKISQSLRQGKIDGISVTASNYHDGTTTVFFDSHQAIEPWVRQYRVAIRTSLRVRHVMASCSIPILFQPIRIGNYLFGDGSLKYNFPFSPALHMGATHVFAISNRCTCPINALGYRPENASIGFIAGNVLNSIFLDSLEQDYENVLKMNRVADGVEVRKAKTILIQPSQDLGFLAGNYLKEVPFHLRQLLLSTAKPAEMGDLLSYLMFSPGYLRALMNLGQKDASLRHQDIKEFLED